MVILISSLLLTSCAHHKIELRPIEVWGSNEQSIPEPVLRLPSKLHSAYEIQVESAKIVNEICIAEAIDELRAV